MPHKGHFGVSMGAIVRRPRKVYKQSRNCFNCKFMDRRRNNCSKIRKNTEGQSSGYVSPRDKKSMATKCMYFDNVHPQQGKKRNSGNKKTNQPSNLPKTAPPKSDLETLRQVQWDRINQEIAKIKKLRSLRQLNKKDAYMCPGLYLKCVHILVRSWTSA